MYRQFKRVVNSDYILKWKSKGFSNKSIESASAPHNFLNSSLTYLDAKIRVKFNGSCLKRDRSTYTHGKIVHIYIVYEITLFSHPNGGTGRNVIIFGVDMSSSTKTDNRKKDVLIIGKGPTQGLKHTLSAEKMYSINITENNKKFCLSLHYNGANSYLFVNGREIHN